MIPGGVPDKEKEIISFANDLIEKCRVSVSMRAAYYRLLNSITETGRYDGMKSLINLMHSHLDRTAAHLFSPVELKFTIDFERPQPKEKLLQAAEVGKMLTRSWERTNTDTMFAQGVFEALKYGAAFGKYWPEASGPQGREHIKYCRRLVMPWQLGVYREDENELDEQEAICETISLTLPEVWRRIWHLPNANKLFDRIKSHAKHGEAADGPASYFHQVLSTSQINTGVSGATRPLPGGIVQLNNDPNYAIMGPQVAAEVVQMHELWVKDATDYCTIQMIEPDVLIAPLYKKKNLLIDESHQQPYRIIQPNVVSGWLWGRSELVDLIEPQGLLSGWLDDFKRLFGLQIDKILAFSGDNTITDELYGQFRLAGYMHMGQSGKVEDLTPKMPPEMLPVLKWLIEMINILGGFPEIMQGRGEAGVRAGVHADTLLKTGSPTLRDRALLVERQCAVHADLWLQIKEAKDAQRYWTKADTIKDMEDTAFLLTDLPDDWRVTVDSHSSSPIFAHENQQLIFALRKTGDVDGEYAIDNLPLPNKEAAKASLREREKNKAQQFQQLLKMNPEIAEKQIAKAMVGGRR